MKTSSADGGLKRWLAWYAPVGRLDRLAVRRPGYELRGVLARPPATARCLVAGLVTAALALGACGGGQPLQPIDRSRLESQLGEVRDAAGRGDRSAARQALDDFVGEVRRLRRAGAVDGPTAAALLLGAQRARDRLEVELAPPPQTQPVQPAPAPAPEVAPKPVPKPKPAGKKAEKAKKEAEQQPKQQDDGSGHDKGHKGDKKH